MNSLTTESDFELYPNPANEKLVLAWNQSISDEKSKISIIRSDGQQVFVQETVSGLSDLTIDTKDWSRGFYLVVFERGDGNALFKKVIID